MLFLKLVDLVCNEVSKKKKNHIFISDNNFRYFYNHPFSIDSYIKWDSGPPPIVNNISFERQQKLSVLNFIVPSSLIKILLLALFYGPHR